MEKVARDLVMVSWSCLYANSFDYGSDQTRRHAGIRGLFLRNFFVPPQILLCAENFLLNI